MGRPKCGTYRGSVECDNCGKCQEEKPGPNYDAEHDEVEE